MKRNGKIARLPRAVREELNAWMADGEEAEAVLSWLHRLPVVWTILERDFGGRRITKQNLSEWRKGGFAEWLTRQEVMDEARELAGDGDDLRLSTKGKLADALATMVTARYAALIRNWDGEVDDGFERKAQVLRGMCRDITALQRGEQRQWKLEMVRTEWETERLDAKEQVVGLFERWANHPGVWRVLGDGQLTEKERRQRLLEVSGFDPETYEKATEEEARGCAPQAEPVAASPSQSNHSDEAPSTKLQHPEKNQASNISKIEEEEEHDPSGRPPEEDSTGVAPSPSQSNQFGKAPSTNNQPSENNQAPITNEVSKREDDPPSLRYGATREDEDPSSPAREDARPTGVKSGQGGASQLETPSEGEARDERDGKDQSEVNPEDVKPDRERRKLYFRDRDLSDAEWRKKYHF